MPQIKQARDRFQNIVPALETFATEFYGCLKFAGAQKISALNNEMSYEIQYCTSSWGRPELSSAGNQEDVLQK